MKERYKGLVSEGKMTWEAADTAIKSMNGQNLCERAISVSHVLDAKVDHCGSAAKKLLAVQKKWNL